MVGFISAATDVDDNDEAKSDEESSASVPKYNMLFNKASADYTTKESSLYTELLNDQSENLVRHRQNAFKGKKYGIGAKLMAKMGYVEGEGLGAHHQGILKPIETQVRKMGVGIGDSRTEDYNEDYDVSSDEEYYKEVPKKSLFQTIKEIESKGVTIPQWIKTVSDENSEIANKPFIALKKETDGNDIDFDELRLKLNEINDQLDDFMNDEKVNEYEVNELQNDLQRTDDNITQYNKLIGVLQECQSLEEDVDEVILLDLVSKIRTFSSLSKIDVDKIIINILKPAITKIIDNWNPLNLDENEPIIETLLNWKSIIPEQKNLDFNGLSYFDSLISSLWLTKIKEEFQNWSTAQPNLAITLLLDWSEIIPDQVFDFFATDVIVPKLIDAINTWNYKDDKNDETPPYVWIFEWSGVLRTGIAEVEREFVSKYKGILTNWDPINDIPVPGLNSFKEIFGESKFNELVNDQVLKKVIASFLNYEFRLNESDVAYEYRLMEKSCSFFHDDELVKKLWDLCFWNQWLHSIHHKLTESTDTNFADFAEYINKFYEFVKPQLNKESSSYFKKGLHLINQYLSASEITPFHQSYSVDSIYSKISKSASLKSNTKAPVEVSSIPSHKLTITFKDVLEKYCNEHNLFLTPLSNELISKTNTGSFNNRGYLFYKIGFDPSGRKGKIGYIEHDVLFLKKYDPNDNEEKFWPISIDELINEVTN